MFHIKHQRKKTRKNKKVLSTGISKLLANLLLLFFPCFVQAEIMGLETIPHKLPYVQDKGALTLLLSKEKYPFEDKCLDLIVCLRSAGSKPDGKLQITVTSQSDGKVVARETIDKINGKQLFFSLPFPDVMAGRKATLEVAWSKAGKVLGKAKDSFEVFMPKDIKRSGRIELFVTNKHGVSAKGMPMIAGVPFPQGALEDESHVRLVDEKGQEIPLQTKVTNRWSRFGYIKWLQCDFTAALHGKKLTLFLEYGPKVTRKNFPKLQITERKGQAPLIDLGILQFGDGLGFKAEAGEKFKQLVKNSALNGAFVLHENGKRYVIPADAKYEIEENGSEKVMLRRRGWYVNENDSKDKFCKFDIRFVLRRNSPVVEIFHTWVYTGYPYKKLFKWVGKERKIVLTEDITPDRIREMGWKFDFSQQIGDSGFLSSPAKPYTWLKGNYLLQHDYDKYEIMKSDDKKLTGSRAPGVVFANSGNYQVALGIKDFWENYPNELQVSKDGLTYDQWPDHGKPAGTNKDTPHQALRLWFAHQGKCLDLAVPAKYTDDPGFQKVNPRKYHLHGFRQTMNAQGIAKTAQMWLLFSQAGTDKEKTAKILTSLNDNNLRLIVDPKWLCSTMALFEIWPKDVKKYPEEERIFELHASAPLHWIERMRYYGKWVWGDMWWKAKLVKRYYKTIYRGFRKNHQGWPYSWIPFARSGDLRFLRLADAATRHLTDIVFNNYSDMRVPRYKMGELPRSHGFYIRHHIPWTSVRFNPGTRGYTDKCNYLWHSYFLTGYPRARDVALEWGHYYKVDGSAGWNSRDDQTCYTGDPRKDPDTTRRLVTQLQTCVDMYQATFDPFFLASAYQNARNQMRLFRQEGWTAHMWNSGPREFMRFSNNEEYRKLYLAYAREWTLQKTLETRGGLWWHVKDDQLRMAYGTAGWGGWSARNVGIIEPASYAYLLTKDEFFLKRITGSLDRARFATYNGSIKPYVGCLVGQENFTPLFTGWFLQYFPFALYAYEKAGHKAEPIRDAFCQYPAKVKKDGKTKEYLYDYNIAIKKTALNKAVPLLLRIHYAEYKVPRLFNYTITDPHNDIIYQGKWDIRYPEELTIPHYLSKGVYRIHIWGSSPVSPETASTKNIPGLHIPVSGVGTPEVMSFEPGSGIGRCSRLAGQYCFMVPKGLRRLQVDLSKNPYTGGKRFLARTNSFAICDGDGKVVWWKFFHRTDKNPPLKAAVDVPASQSGKVWRIVTPGAWGGCFTLNPQIKPVFSVSRSRWFDPDAKCADEKAGHTPEPARDGLCKLPAKVKKDAKTKEYLYDYNIAIKKTALNRAVPFVLRVRYTKYKTPRFFNYTVTDPYNDIIYQGKWDIRYAEELTIPHFLTKGVYRIHIWGSSPVPPGKNSKLTPGLYIPLSSAGTPEVMLFKPGSGTPPVFAVSKARWFNPNAK